MPEQAADLVLEGGGVKGIALVGAVHELSAAGYRFPRVAGSSAGAIVGALLAALQRAGEPVQRLVEVMRALDYRAFRDQPLLTRLAGPVGDVAELLAEDGLYEGDRLRQWLASSLAALGVRTFGDLRLGDDPGGDLPPARRYRLVVTASDLSRRRLVRLPWDYPDYDRDPDEAPVADAVRASAAIPLFFQPVRLAGSTLVDGGLLSNYPIDVFDRTDRRAPRWPTFGVRLSARPGPRPVTRPVEGPVSVALATVETLLTANDAAHVDQPCVQARTVFVDTSGVSAVDFDLSVETRERLYAAGRGAARTFLAGWDFPAYVARCRSVP